MSNNQTFDSIIKTNSSIAQDWYGGYKLELNLTAKDFAKNWELDFKLPGKIRAAYGVDLIDRGNGNYSINGQKGRTNLGKGQSLNPILIVDTHEEATLPEFKSSMSYNPQPQSLIKTNSSIAQDWYGGYKLELNLTAQDFAKNWELDFKLPGKIRAAYGVDLIDRGNGNYSINGQKGRINLGKGQSLNPILIVDTHEEATLPEFKSSMSYDAAPVQAAAKSNNNDNIISVDNDFGGDLKKAIAAASDGDLVRLGNRTYYASNIQVDKDITIDGVNGTVIDGGNTSGTVINITSGASGATIQDLEITNANNGIFSNGAKNLTLQNLDINNIGINQVIRDGQNNTGMTIGYADGLKIIDSKLNNIGRNGINVKDTQNAVLSGITVQNVNLDAQHAQSHDAAGIKFFNTNNVTLKNSYLSDINAFHIWNDTTTNTVIDGNTVERVGEDFLAPSFNKNVDIGGIYNEKSHNSIVKNNQVDSVGRFVAYRATEFTTETMSVYNNDFDRIELGSTDYWVNESAEKLIAVTEDPAAANFSLFANEYNAYANIG